MVGPSIEYQINKLTETKIQYMYLTVILCTEMLLKSVHAV